MGLILAYLDSGAEPAAALREAALDIAVPKPLAQEMSAVLLMMDAGNSVGEALKAVADRVQMPEFDLLATIFADPSRTRLTLMQSLERVSASLRTRNIQLGAMRSTEQEAVVAGGIFGAMPFTLLGGMNVFAPGHVEALAQSGAGRFMLYLSMALVMFGVAWVCSRGRTHPGMSLAEIREKAASLPRRLLLPGCATIVPAMLILLLGPNILN